VSREEIFPKASPFNIISLVTMGLADALKSIDAHSSVAKEFRVYTVQGAVLSVATVLCIVYLLFTEMYFNFQLTLEERVYVNATSPRGLEMEFDISLPHVSCAHISVDAADTSGQSQSLHLDRQHHVWKHRFRMSEDGKHKILIGSKSKLELGSTMLAEDDLEELLDKKVIDDDFDSDSESASASEDSHSNSADSEAKRERKEKRKAKKQHEKTLNASLDGDGVVKQKKRRIKDNECGSCYGAGQEGECCNTCEDVRRAYKLRGWVLHDSDEIEQCKKENIADQTGEGCNVHGKVALSSGGGNLHLAPGKDYGSDVTPSTNIFDMLLQSFQKWNVSHSVHKIRFGPEYPAAVYQLDGADRIVTDSSAMYQYYFQVRSC